MREKMIVCVVAVFIFCAVSACAQKWPSAERIVAEIQSELNMGQEQLGRVRFIIEENMFKRQELIQKLPGGLTQTQSQPLDAELYRKLSGVLTRSQMNQWNKILSLMLQDMYASTGGK